MVKSPCVFIIEPFSLPRASTSRLQHERTQKNVQTVLATPWLQLLPMSAFSCTTAPPGLRLS